MNLPALEFAQMPELDERVPDGSTVPDLSVLHGTLGQAHLRYPHQRGRIQPELGCAHRRCADVDADRSTGERCEGEGHRRIIRPSRGWYRWNAGLGTAGRRR